LEASDELPSGANAYPGSRGARFQVQDWVLPTEQWQTFETIWEWPPYCRGSMHRNILIGYTGPGEVWIDDVQLFPWKDESAP
jgi:hypothetical protein